MTYTIKDKNGNIIYSIENADPSKSEEGILGSIGKGALNLLKGAGIAAGACTLGLIALLIAAPGVSKRRDRKLQQKAEQILASLGTEKSNYTKNYFKSTYVEVSNIILKTLNKNKNIFPQLSEIASDNIPEEEFIKASKNMMDNAKVKTFNFLYMINAWFKYADLEKMGIKVDEYNNIDSKYDDTLDKLHDKAIKDSEIWINKSLKDIKLPITLSNGSKIVSIRRDKENEYTENYGNYSDCELVTFYNIYVDIEYSSEFNEKIIKTIEEKTQTI